MYDMTITMHVFCLFKIVLLTLLADLIHSTYILSLLSQTLYTCPRLLELYSDTETSQGTPPKGLRNPLCRRTNPDNFVASRWFLAIVLIAAAVDDVPLEST
jgi:hypothetical protein